VCLAVLAAGAAGAAARWYQVTRPEYRYGRGRKALEAGDHAVAAGYADALEAAGEPGRAALLRAEASLLAGDPAAGLKALEPLTPDGPLGVEAAVLAGRCLMPLGMPRAAHLNFHAALARDPENADAHRGLAALHYDLGDLSRALHHLKEVKRLDPGDGRSSRLAGLIHLDLANDEAAVSEYRDALGCTLRPTAKVQARQELASALIRLTRYDDALEELARADREVPATSAIREFLRADALSHLGRDDEALAVLRRGLLEFPSSAQMRSLRGRILLGKRQRAEAISDLERARDLEPGDYQTLHHLAQAYESVKRDVDAARTRAQAEATKKLLDRMTETAKETSKKPFDPEVRYEMGRLAEALGNRELARMWYNRGKSLERKPK
jgi:tetratricopeptide (TPR) repeat protein